MNFSRHVDEQKKCVAPAAWTRYFDVAGSTDIPQTGSLAWLSGRFFPGSIKLIATLPCI
jgi:hypothetical protein